MVRLLSGLGLAAAFLAIIWFSSANVLGFVAAAVATLAVHEYTTIARQIGAHPPLWFTVVTTLLTLWVVAFQYQPVEVVLTLALVVLAIMVMASERSGAAVLHDTAAAMLAPIYIGLPLGALVGIHVYGGRLAVLLLMTTIVVSDSAQYYAGRTFGRRPLAPRLSPKKTIEGALGGFVIAPAFLVFASYYWLPLATNQLLLAGLGIALVAAGIAGDLFESMLKRAAQLKDSSALIPGHGGVLDRIDALLFGAPVFYLFIRYVYSI